MERLLQNPLVFALALALTVMAASAVAVLGLELTQLPRSYAEIVSTPTRTRGPDTPTRRILPTPTRRATPSALPLAIPDAFAMSRAWPQATSGVTVTSVLSGAMYLVQFVRPASGEMFLSRDHTLPGGDLALQLEAAVEGVGNDINLGLVLYYNQNPQTREERFVAFTANTRGGYRIQARLGAERVIDLTPRAYSRTLREPVSRFRFRVDSRENRMLFILNDEVLADLEGETIAAVRSAVPSGGRLGVVASSDQPRVRIYFSKLQVYHR